MSTLETKTVAGRESLDWGQRLSDRANPILVREVLQAMSGKLFMLTMASAVIGVVMIGLWVVAFELIEGRDVLQAAILVLAPIVTFIVPLQAFLSMRHEVSGGVAEQLLLTGLTPRRIVFGKLAAAFAMFVLFAGMFAPVFAMTYLLRGVDLVSILVVLAFSMFASLLANAFAIAIAALARVGPLAPVSFVVVIAGLGFGTAGVMGGAWELVREISRSVVSADFRAAMGMAVCAFLAATWLFAAIAGAMLAHEHENRSTQFRLFAVFVPTVVFVWFWSVAPTSALNEAGPGIAGVLALVLAPLLLALVSEGDALSPRVARYVPRRPLTALLAAPFLPGGGRAIVLLVLVSAAIFLAGLWLLPALAPRPPASATSSALAMRMDEEYWRTANVTLVAWGYVWIYASLGRWLRRRVARWRYPFWQAFFGILISIVLFACASLLFFAIERSNSYHIGHIMNVPFTLSRVAFRRDSWVVSWVVLLGVVALATRLPNAIAGVREVLEASRRRREIES